MLSAKHTHTFGPHSHAVTLSLDPDIEISWGVFHNVHGIVQNTRICVVPGSQIHAIFWLIYLCRF